MQIRVVKAPNQRLCRRRLCLASEPTASSGSRTTPQGRLPASLPFSCAKAPLDACSYLPKSLSSIPTTHTLHRPQETGVPLLTGGCTPCLEAGASLLHINLTPTSQPPRACST